MAQEARNIQESLKENYRLAIIAGIIILLMGMIAIASPFVSGIPIVIIVGIMLIIGGISQFAFTLKLSFTGVYYPILLVPTLVIGADMVMSPGDALSSLTILLVTYLVASGLFETIMSIKICPHNGCAWVLLSGIVSVLFSVIIFNHYPVPDLSFIVILLGVRLLFSGLSLIMLGIASRDLSPNI